MAATQVERPLSVRTSLGADALVLSSFHGYERVSTPYRFVLELLSPDPNIDIQSLLTKPAVLGIAIDENTGRFIHGHFKRIKLRSIGEDGMACYEAEIVPWLWFLTRFSDCRIFQRKTVPEIIEKVFKDRGFGDYSLRLQGTYPQRDYCVQYRETDFNFVSRLMEDEGIFYFFEQANDKHTLVLADHNTAFKSCPHQARARYLSAQGELESKDTVLSLESEYLTQTGTVSHTDYDFEKPHNNLFATLSGTGKIVGEDYDYPGDYSDRDEGDRYARVRLEEREAGILTAHGESNCEGFECGYAFELTEHCRDDANCKYAIIALEHSGRNPSYRSGETHPYFYRNSFEAIPAAVPYRPRRIARKPLIFGTQTAVVTGRSGEEIYTDKYGRVKVHFHWDREGKHDEDSSCWIRVAQGWAGKGWGEIHLPRIGQEVIVSFLEGDPDRPLITGSVYNAEQTVPYGLPGEQTKSTLKSMSSKGGGGFNELRFEDKKGGEEVFLQAEKDLEIRVKNDRSETVERNRNLTVGNDRFENVRRDAHREISRDSIEKLGRDHHLVVAGKEAIEVAGSHSSKVKGDVIQEFGSNQTLQVTQVLYVKGMQLILEAATAVCLKVGGNFITIDPSGVAIKGTIVQINSGGAALSGSSASCVPPLSPTAARDAIQAQAGAMAASAAAGTITPASLSLAKLSAASNAPTHNAKAPENEEKKSWIEIELFDDEKAPVAGEPYRVTLADGTTVADGTLDEQGFARVDHIDPGTCKVTFPNLDKEMWDRKPAEEKQSKTAGEEI